MFDMSKLTEDEIQDSAKFLETVTQGCEIAQAMVQNPDSVTKELALDMLNDLSAMMLVILGASQMVLETVAIQNNVDL